MGSMPEPVVLASASTARAALLRDAGVDFTVEPAQIDEARLKRDARERGDSAAVCATQLAAEKARVISRRRPKALVIGADQLLESGGEWFDKPHDLADARRQLRRLRGGMHRLATAVSVFRHGGQLWQATSVPELTMRGFSDAFLDAYIGAEGEALLGSVGAYRLEGRGVQLFEGIAGDYFAVLGLPLIALLGFLRSRGALLS